MMMASRNANWKNEDRISRGSSSNNALNHPDWKRSYSSLEDVAETDADKNRLIAEANGDLPPIVVEMIANASAKPKKEKDETRIISKRDTRTLLLVRDMILAHKEREELRRKCRTITTVEPAQFDLDPTSTVAFIFRALQDNETKHINTIIANIEQLGWTTTSTYHKYSEVYSAINKHYYMFDRVGRATFRLREAFSNRTQTRSERIVRPQTPSQDLVRLKDVAAYVVQKFYRKPGLSAHLVWSIMRHIGYSCHYSSVQRVMQDKKLFSRRGRCYTTKRNAKTSPKENPRAAQS
jgi:hypothetical protein